MTEPTAAQTVTIRLRPRDAEMAAFALRIQAGLCESSNNEFAAEAYRAIAKIIEAARPDAGEESDSLEAAIAECEANGWHPEIYRANHNTWKAVAHFRVDGARSYAGTTPLLALREAMRRTTEIAGEPEAGAGG